MFSYIIRSNFNTKIKILKRYKQITGEIQSFFGDIFLALPKLFDLLGVTYYRMESPITSQIIESKRLILRITVISTSLAYRRSAQKETHTLYTI